MASPKLPTLFTLIISASITHFAFCSKHLKDDGFTDEQVENIKKEIDTLRSNVVPTACNLRKIRFSSDRATEAKYFTDRCQIPNREETSKFGEEVTKFEESWYFNWTSKTPDELTNILFPFHTKYDYDTNSCEPSAKDCDFYKSMISDEVYFFGCSRNSTCQGDFTEITVCVMAYRQLVNPPYVAGPPCSRCEATQGTFCHENLCTHSDACKSLNCTCETKCKNCGVLNEKTCTCECKYGYDLIDCSGKCENRITNCVNVVGHGNKKGSRGELIYISGKGKEACNMNFIVKLHWCRRMCGMCETLKPYAADDPRTLPCCPGVVCPNGKPPNMDCKCEAAFGLTEAQLQGFLKVSNQWRTDVRPSAANLHRLEMESNNVMATEAKTFTDKCDTPPLHVPDRFWDYAYITWTANDSVSLSHFYKEYNFSSDSCVNSTVQECEVFKVFIADTSFELGCSRNIECESQGKNFKEITVCIVRARNTQRDPKPLYVPGKPCTRCNKHYGTFCHDGLCISKAKCRKERLTCRCERRCTNCSAPDDETCTCECLYGYYGLQCDEPCRDQVECENRNSFWIDSDLKRKEAKGEGCEKDVKFTTRDCPRHCKKCHDALEKSDPEQPLSLKCCNGAICPTTNKFGFTDAQWKGFLDAGNKWRSEVQPTATNLHRLDLSYKLCEEAKFYTDNCNAPPFHVPSRLPDYNYVTLKSKDIDDSTDPLRFLYKKYNFSNDSCLNATKEQCELFKAFIADTSVEMGCSRNNYCEKKGKNFGQITVCVIGPRSDFKPLYIPGKPCTKCVEEYGSFCHKKLCVSKEKCRKDGIACACERRCANCSEANEVTCTCKCLYGYDGLQCEDVCLDRANNCSNLLGYGFDAAGNSIEKKGKEACGIDFKFARRKCPKFCGKCRGALRVVDPDQPLSRKCCPDLVCPSNKSPDFSECVCRKISLQMRDFLPGNCPVKKNSADYVAFRLLFLFVSIIIFI